MSNEKILLVLDNIQSARHLTAVLEGQGYTAQWQALNDAAAQVAHRPDLIIFDSLLLDEEELRIFNNLRKREGWRDIPILVIATILDGRTRAKIRTLGADGIIPKPIDTAELLVKIRSALRLRVYESEGDSASRTSRGYKHERPHQELAIGGRLANLSYVASTYASHQSLETILVQLLRDVRQIVGFDEGLIYVEVQPGRYSVLTNIGGGKLDLSSCYKVGESYTGWIVQRQQPLLVHDIDKETRIRAAGREEGRSLALNSFVGVPLVSGDHVIGALELGSYTCHSFSDATLETLRPFAEIACIALESAKVRQDFAQQVNSLWEEFDRYRRQLLPIFRSSAMDQVMKAARTVRDNACPVLITGETGTGKELVARYIHYESRRKHFPFVDINCAAVPESLQETELFGIEKGIATGVDKHIGKFEQAGAGALFLDEIADMPLLMQVKILRVLQERIFERVGGKAKLDFRGRILAATSRDISHAIRGGTFREELYYRLAVVHLHIPPLRERREDIPPLVDHFVRLFCAEQGRPLLTVPQKAMGAFVEHDWPGNVRELRNAVERAVLFAQGTELQFCSDLLASGTPQANCDPVALALNLAFQQKLSMPTLVERYSQYVYQRLGCNKSLACKWLEINYRTLHKRVHNAESVMRAASGVVGETRHDTASTVFAP